MNGAAPVLHPLVALMRRFAVDWLARADPVACREIMADGYTAAVGGVALVGREDSYIPATTGQLQRFPGLLVTVHDLFTDGDRVALRFTEHGAATERAGAAAAWAGIGIFDWDGGRLTANVTEEDYLARRRQLATGIPDPVATPATAPWSARPVDGDAGSEQAVRSWLATGDLAADGRVGIDDGWTGQPTGPLVDQESVDIDTLFSAGTMVAFHATQHGAYLGGLDVPPSGRDAVDLRVTGMVCVDHGDIVGGHLIRDRVGLRRTLVGR